MLRFALAALALASSAWAQAQPDAVELKYALILTRHGVRAPTWTPERLNEYSATAWPDFGVPPSHLTAHGRTLMEIMGRYYRELLTERGLLGSSACGDAARTYIWADIDQRTIETGRALAETIVPGCKVEVHSLKDVPGDPLFDGIEAGAWRQDAQLGLAAVSGRIGPRLDALIESHRPAFDELVRILNGGGRAAKSIFEERAALTAGESGVAMSGPLRLASTLTENLLLEYTNGMQGDRLGWGRLNANNLLQIMTLHTAYADLLRRTPNVARVRGSNLLNRIARSLEQAAAGKPVRQALGPANAALVVISGHDTNVSNLSGLLNLSWTVPSHQTDDVPPGGALVFSLWRTRGTGRYSVRLQFVTQTLDQMRDARPLSLKEPPAVADLFIPGCSVARPGYPCDLAAFQRIVRTAIDPAFVQ